MVVVPVGRGLSARPTVQNSSSLPTEIIEMDRDGLGGGGGAGGCMRMQHHGTGWRATKGIRTKTLRTETLLLRDCLHGGGGPQVGELTRLSIQSLILILSRLHDRWGDPPRVTSPIWGPPPPCKQTLK